MKKINSEMNNLKKAIEMTDEELLEAYKKGEKWVSNRMQVVGTGKDALGKKYNNDVFLAGLDRLESIMDELNKRGIAYG